MNLRSLIAGTVAGLLCAVVPATSAHALGTGAWSSPAGNGYVSGSLSLVFSSSDVSVEFSVDGTDIGPGTADGNGYFVASWNSAAVLDGAHTLHAKECAITCDTVDLAIHTSNGHYPADPAPIQVSPPGGATVGAGTVITVTGTGTVAAYTSTYYGSSSQVQSHALPWTTTVADAFGTGYLGGSLSLTVRHCNGADCNAFAPQTVTYTYTNPSRSRASTPTASASASTARPS